MKMTKQPREAGCEKDMEKELTKNSSPKIYHPPIEVRYNAQVTTMAGYNAMYKESVENPTKFWTNYSKKFYFKERHEGEVFDYNFDATKGKVYVKCMEKAVTNICYNCLDIHVEAGHGDTIAFYWEGNDPQDCTTVTYKQLLDEVCRFSNVLKQLGVEKGDRVTIYMPMIIELVVSMLACARIGAMHSIVYGGFSADSLSSRIWDAKCDVLITADGGYRGTKVIKLKEIADEAVKKCNEQGHLLKHVVVVKHITGESYSSEASARPSKRPTGQLQVQMNSTDKWYHDLMKGASTNCECKWMNSEDNLFMLYTSGSAGKPKCVVHSVTGYMLWASATHNYTFDYHPNDVYFCTADIGWITGHTYTAYGPLLNRATSVMFEGIPAFPDASRYWQIVDKYQVSRFYTAPTAIRALMKFGETTVKNYKRDSLRVIGTVGEPINAEAWLFCYNVVGNKKCSVVDTFWQTETGGHVLTPLPGCTPQKPGSCAFPFFGVVPAIMNERGEEITGEGEGHLVFKQPWPGIMRTVYNDHDSFEKVYFSKFPGCYVTGDGCYRDKDGYYWITGRIDDMMNVSGRLLSTSEVESALTKHKSVSEAACVSTPHSVKGESIYCFVTVVDNTNHHESLKMELVQLVRESIGPFASPDCIQFASQLPKTRSGKVMRRVLRKVARNDRDVGDVSTMADPSCMDMLYKNRVAC